MTDLTAVAGDPGEGLAIDDEAPADADLARHVQDVARADGGAASDLGQRPKVGFVGDPDR
jgi:hypothetical protein